MHALQTYIHLSQQQLSSFLQNDSLTRFQFLRTHVTLDGVTQSHKTMIDIIQQSTSITELQFLRIVNWNFIRDLPRCEHLRVITCSVCVITGLDVLELTNKFPMIEKINLNYTQIHLQDFWQFARWRFLRDLSVFWVMEFNSQLGLLGEVNNWYQSLLIEEMNELYVEKNILIRELQRLEDYNKWLKETIARRVNYISKVFLKVWFREENLNDSSSSQCQQVVEISEPPNPGLVRHVFSDAYRIKSLANCEQDGDDDERGSVFCGDCENCLFKAWDQILTGQKKSLEIIKKRYEEIKMKITYRSQVLASLNIAAEVTTEVTGSVLVDRSKSEPNSSRDVMRCTCNK